ncbi:MULTISPECIES: molybdopterin-guanine dinucleotide biosynthesis protein B [Salinicola]|uniref:Molybdopterin-guanine dinucleotide biosynthesis protein B n=1 Tax=Salinicola socius TaxID=404433 RepID=A0A1Q8SRW2_9GAMM|nr:MULTISPECIES: molybdopterin-guanine dinucleotide biosynthesis protein B [Salinicola]OLO04178.1 molybdopterin-guanine dinucleotide biosynthesis protein B [Salinicola socius]
MSDAASAIVCDIPLLGIAAWSGTGKTTLLEALLPRLRERGWPTAVIKHAHHDFDVDKPGKDSHRLREAGATPMVVASGRRFALMMETPGQQEPDLALLVAQVAALKPALILVEGFKTWPIPKLELYRGSQDRPPAAGGDPWVQALAYKPAELSVVTLETLPSTVRQLNLDDLEEILDWMIDWASRQQDIQR